MKDEIDRIVDETWKNAQAEFIPIQILSDDSGHTYIVPNELVDDFNKMKNYICEHEDEEDVYHVIEEFIAKFSKYATGGDINNYQLLISKEELNRLTA